MIIFEARASIILYNVLVSIKNPDTFILPLNVCPIVPAVFLKAKVKFEFIDISAETLCIDQKILYKRLQSTDKIGGVLFVKTFGINYDTDHIYKKIKAIDNNIFIIDDACLQKPNFEYDFKRSYADLSLFSTGYSKYVDINWGGFGFLQEKYNYVQTKLPFVRCDLEHLTESFLKATNNHSMLSYCDTNWLGDDNARFIDFEEYKEDINSKITLIQQHKTLINNIYKKELPQYIQLGDEFSNWRFSILVSNKQKLLDEIFKQGLFASSHYGPIDYMYNKNCVENSNAGRIHDKLVNLFNDFRFDQAKACQIVDIINKHVLEQDNG